MKNYSVTHNSDSMHGNLTGNLYDCNDNLRNKKSIMCTYQPINSLKSQHPPNTI